MNRLSPPRRNSTNVTKVKKAINKIQNIFFRLQTSGDVNQKNELLRLIFYYIRRLGKTPNTAVRRVLIEEMYNLSKKLLRLRSTNALNENIANMANFIKTMQNINTNTNTMTNEERRIAENNIKKFIIQAKASNARPGTAMRVKTPAHQRNV
jgi:hypothetical protein